MEKERDGPRVAPEPTMRSDLEQMPEISNMALEDESDEVVQVPEVRQCRVFRNYRVDRPRHVFEFLHKFMVSKLFKPKALPLNYSR